MEEMIQQIRTAHAGGLFYLSLSSTLALPDVCAALSSPDGETSGKLYKQWYKDNVVPPQFADLTAEECYKFRCKVLHQGSSRSDLADGRYEQIIFYAAKPGEKVPRIGAKVVHPPTGIYKLIDLEVFITTILDAAFKWWEKNHRNVLVKANSTQLLRCFPEGLPWIKGLGARPIYACIPPIKG